LLLAENKKEDDGGIRIYFPLLNSPFREEDLEKKRAN